MYPISLYKAFVQFRKQYYKIKTRDGWDKYHQIEQNRRDYHTFQRFYDEAHSYIYSMEKDMTVQEVFDDMLDRSQSKYGILRLCY